MERSREKVRGDRVYICSSTQHSILLYSILLCSSAVGLEMEMEEGTNRSHSESRDPLTPEPQDPAPQKRKKKKKAPTLGSEAFTTRAVIRAAFYTKALLDTQLAKFRLRSFGRVQTVHTAVDGKTQASRSDD